MPNDFMKILMNPNSEWR